MWNREEEASAVRYEDEHTAMETTANWERPATVGYATTTEKSQPSERATGVLANEEVAYDLENDEIVNEEPSERASGVLTTEEVAFDLEEPYLRTEEPSERAIGALTTEEVAYDLEDDYLRMEKPSESAADELTTKFDEETTRKTTVNVCNGARCRCLEALPVEVKYVNYLPSKKAEGDASVVPLEKKTDTEESDSPATMTDVPWPLTPEFDRNRTGDAPIGVPDEPSAVTEGGATPTSSPSHTRLFTKEELEALEAKKPSSVSVELEEYDKELGERLFPLDEVELERRVVRNAAKAKEPSLEELSVPLNLPVETVRGTREASPGDLSTPEYWLDWFKKTLAASAKAKRANRDFRADFPPTKEAARAKPGPSGPSESEDANGEVASVMNKVVASVMNEVVASIVPSSRVAAITVNESRDIANIGVSRAEVERKDEDAPQALPFRLRTLVRSVVFLLILDEEAKNGARCPKCHYPEAYPPEVEPRGHFVPGPFSAERLTRARELVIERAGVLGDGVMQSVLNEISRAYLESVSLTLAKKLERGRTCWWDRPVREPLLPRRVGFDCSSLAAERSEALGSHTGCVEDPDDVLNYVCFVKDGSVKKEKRKQGLMEMKDRSETSVDPNNDAEDPVPEGKRVICSVEWYEATSVGFIDSLPAELLIDTGAIASLVDSRVLEKLGLAKAPLRPYHGSLNGVSGHPLHILDVLRGAKLYSTMDIASGYWNVPMDPDSVEKTAFTCKYGLFEWLVMPFGLCNAVPAFERLMENVLVDLKWRTCLVYLDDCVVFNSDFPTHLVRLHQVLERFRNAGFKLKMKKCRWGRDQVAFLGHIVTPTGILPNPEKVKAVMNVARPHDLHTVRAFLGLTSYFRRYIPGYAAISAPIERLKVKGAEFVWNADCEAAFLQLKRRLVEPPILVYPDFSQRFKLYVDSSRLAVGACLMETVDGRERVVAYASKLLVGSEKNWIYKTDGTSEIECWGIVWATRKFRCYLDRTEFDLYTDHKALTWVFNENNRTTNAKLARWAMELSQLRFKVYHKPDSSQPDEGPVSVGEGSSMGRNDEGTAKNSPATDGALDKAVRAAMDALNEVGEPSAPLGPSTPDPTLPMTPLAPSPTPKTPNCPRTPSTRPLRPPWTSLD
ncbi:hypothetical protein PR003_g18414 [Phytophthora rubi]|uniref:Reverse transcriptase n=2 Tax=Phytophthora rubi TaxID=129364 RepID=A0A6A4E0V8_9STRA|nr:hypothetical protein PR003_g18414 [Phytophthora rubi]